MAFRIVYIPAATVTNDIAIFADHLESFLSENWVEWGKACNEIEALTGINLSKNQLAYRTTTINAKGNVPEMLETILAKSAGR
ncbi:hypothetical protein ACTV18_001828 [Escherichia coli]